MAHQPSVVVEERWEEDVDQQSDEQAHTGQDKYVGIKPGLGINKINLRDHI